MGAIAGMCVGLVVGGCGGSSAGTPPAITGESVAQCQTTAPAFEHVIHTAQYSGSSLAALRVVVHDAVSHCY